MARRVEVVIAGDATSLERAFGAAGAASTGFGASMTRAGSHMTALGSSLSKLSLPIIAVGYEAVKMGLNFQESMHLLTTQAGATQVETDKMTKGILRMVEAGQSFGQKAIDMAKGMFYIQSEGIRGARALEILRAASAGAALGHSTLAETTNALTSAMKVFKLPAQEAGTAMATLNATVGAGKMHMEDLNAALSTKLLPTAQILGITLPQVGAALDVFTQVGVPAESAATNLTTSFIKFLAPTHAAVKILKEMGLSATDLAGKLQTGGLPLALGTLVKRYDAVSASMGKIRANQDIIGAFGGLKGGAAVLTLVQQYKSYMADLGQVQSQNSPGTFWSMAATAMKQPAEKIHEAVAKIGAVLIQLGMTLTPFVAAAAGFISNLAQAFEKLSPSTKKFVEIAAGVVAVLGPALVLIGSLATGIGLLASPIGIAVVAFAAVAAGLAYAYTHSERFRLAVQELVADVKAKWPEIRATIEQVMNSVRSIIESVVTIVSALWAQWGKTIMTVVDRDFHAAVTVIKDVFSIIASTFKFFADLLQGHWGRAWGDLKNIASKALDAVVTLLKAEVQNFFTIAVALGKALADGVLSGLEGLAGKVVGVVKGALGWFAHPHFSGTPHEHASAMVGQPLAEGVIDGFLLGISPLPAKVSASITAALTAAKAVIDAGRVVLKDAWGNLVTDAGSAFDALAAAFQTPMEKLIAAQLGKRAAASLQDQLGTANDNFAKALRENVDAIAGVAAAQAKLDDLSAANVKKPGSVSDDTVTAAQTALREAQQKVTDTTTALKPAWQAQVDAKFAIQLAGEQKIAVAQRLQQNARDALNKRHLLEQLDTLQTNLAKQGATHKAAQESIITLLNSYGISYHSSGLALGAAFAKGIEESIGAAVAAAKKLAEAVSRYLPRSPAKEGPLSKLPNWDSLMPKFNTGAARGTTGMALAGVAGVSAGGAGGGPVFNFYGPVYDKEGLMREVRTGVSRLRVRDGMAPL